MSQISAFGVDHGEDISKRGGRFLQNAGRLVRGKKPLPKPNASRFMGNGPSPVTSSPLTGINYRRGTKVTGGPQKGMKLVTGEDVARGKKRVIPRKNVGSAPYAGPTGPKIPLKQHGPRPAPSQYGSGQVQGPTGPRSFDEQMKWERSLKRGPVGPDGRR